MARRGKPDYGLDAPGLQRFFVVTGSAALFACLLLAWFVGFRSSFFIALVVLCGVFACYLLGMGILMLVYSRVVKVRVRERLLDQLSWHGTERVLDAGCGRGVMLIGAARRLTTGTAIGVDIWQAQDQSANGPDGALANARIEGVGDRIKVETADIRALPFHDAEFDVVLSHWVVHKLASETDRSQAVAEMCRVLRPGGWIVLSDIAFRDAYLVELADRGFLDRRLAVAPLQDAVLQAVSFGSFAPATIFARKPG